MARRLRLPKPPTLSPAVQTTGAFGLFLLAAVLFYAKPILGHFSSDCACIPTTTDEGIVAWGLAWWPHAILHGLNPFFPRILYAPAGIDIAHGTMMPAAAVVLWPLTALTSPLFSFNVAATLAPALAATTAFHLCRTLSGRALGALVGGWLFGFSTYMLGQQTGHLNLTLVFLVPVAVELAVLTHRGRIRQRTGAILEAVMLILQLLLSLEIFATLVLFGAITLLLAWLLAPRSEPAVRAGLSRTSAAAVLGLIGSLIVCSPYLYYVLKPGGEPDSATRSTTDSADLLGYVIPNQLTRAGGVHFLSVTERFSAGYVEGGVYLGLPLLVLVAAVLWAGRRRWTTRLAGAVLLVALICALGDKLQIKGHQLFPLPWDLAAHLPLLGVALPVRLVMYAALCCALLVAVGLAQARGRWLAAGWTVALLAVASLWPNTSPPFWHSDPDVPRLFTTDAYRRILAPHSGNVLILPVGSYGESMLWQAEAKLGFTMASGYVVPPDSPDPYSSSPLHTALEYGIAPGDTPPARVFLATHHVTSVVMSIIDAEHSSWPQVLTALRWRGEVVDGAVVFRAPVARAAHGAGA